MTGKTTGRVDHARAPIAYFDAMKMEIRGALACTLQAQDFAEWVDEMVAKARDPEAVRRKLAGHDFVYNADRFNAMSTLIEAGVTLEVQS